jgi:hypothetical protein
VPAGLEPHGVDGAVHLGNPEDLGDLVRQRRILGDVHGLAAERASLGQAVGVAVSDDDGRGTEQM